MLPALALILAALTAVAVYLVPAYFGRFKPGYSHLRHTISELGEAGSPIGPRVSYLGFVPIGLLSRGLVQRVAETLIFGGIVLIGWWVFRGGA